MPVVELKLVLIGGTAVGKTCIVQRSTSGCFESDTMPTLGASYTSKMVKVSEQVDARIQIWDTAGQERYRGMTPMYYHGASAALIVYSITERESFKEVDMWAKSLRDHAQPTTQLYLVGNKADLENGREVGIEEGQDKAAELGAHFTEVSAKTGMGVEELFTLVASVYVENMGDTAEDTAIDLNSSEKKKKCC